MRTFEITASGNELAANAGSRAELTFTVTSRAEHPLVGRTALRPPEGIDSAWLKRSPERLRFSSLGTEQVTVSLEPPANAPEGRHELKLVVANEDNPDDDWTESAPVGLVIRAAPRRRRFPDWLPYAAAAAVLVIGGAFIANRLMQKPGFRAECEPGDCADGLVCTERGDDLVCLGDVGWKCFAQDHCGDHLSCANEQGERPQRVEAEAIEGQVGAEEEQARAEEEQARAEEAAPEDSPNPDAADEREPASVSAEVIELPANLRCRVPQPLWGCDGDRECAPSQSCVSMDEGTICALNEGERCRVDVQCATTWCKEETCTEYTGRCDGADDCRSGEVCESARCQLPLGHACTDDDRCASGNCDDGICKASDVMEPPDPCRGVRCRLGTVCFGGRCVPFDDFVEKERMRLFKERSVRPRPTP